MSSKKLINEPANVVDEALAGFVSVHPNTALLADSRIVYRKDVATTKDTHVSVICGGGSGHEPAHIGYVGDGLLTAAVCGDVFASPSAKQVETAILHCGGQAGVLLIIKCYTGDRLHFALAAERARAKGIRVEIVTVGEDAAIPGNSNSLAGRRGLCGTVWVYKAACAAIQAGAPLQAAAKIAQECANNCATMNVALGPCCIPGKEPSFQLGPKEMELGLGIHGEAGYMRHELTTAKRTVKTVIDLMLSTSEDRNYLPCQEGDRVVLIVNNLGSTTNLELSIVCGEALAYLSDDVGLVVERVYSGTFMTAIDMPGISLSLIKVDDTRLGLFDAPTNAPSWPSNQGLCKPKIIIPGSLGKEANAKVYKHTSPTSSNMKLVFKIIEAVANVVISKEKELTDYDKIVGDGDCGTTLEEAGNAILLAMKNERLPNETPAGALQEISEVLEENIGGSSGALYCIGLEAAARQLLKDENLFEPLTWMKAFSEATKAIMQLGARKGHRTMLDAMIPVMEVFEKYENESNEKLTGDYLKQILKEASDVSLEGALSTKKMVALAGRTTYINEEHYKGTPDPGAMAVAYWFQQIVATLTEA